MPLWSESVAVSRSARLESRISDLAPFNFLPSPARSVSNPSYRILSGTMQHEIPVEIWALVIADTCKADQRTCLSVSRTWRKIAISLVFSTVQIHFGFGLENPWRDEQHPYRSSHEEITKMSRSWEILDRIGDDPDFARVVKRIVVLAFAKGHTIFERRKYIKVFSLVLL